MNIILPDRETVDIVHEAVLAVSGGRPGVHNGQMIEKALTRPLTFTQYVDDYSLDTICALLIDSIARYHGFSDGNKRTALMTAIFTYRVNGVHFDSSEAMNRDFDELIMWVVTHKPDIADITEKLEQLRKVYAGREHAWSEILMSLHRFRLHKLLSASDDDTIKTQDKRGTD